MTADKRLIAKPERRDVLTLREEDWPGKSAPRVMSEVAVSPAVGSSTVSRLFTKHTHTQTDLTATLEVLQERIGAVKRNDLSGADEMLTSQAATLDVVFNELMRRAGLNLSHNMEATETYMRLALKTQGQCRATWEAIAAIKNPSIAYAKQVNFSAGHQQVNNGVGSSSVVSPSAQAEIVKPPIEVLEDQRGKRMDFGTSAEAGRTYSHLAAMGAGHRPPDTGRERAFEDEPLHGRKAAEVARAGKSGARHPRKPGARTR